MILRALRRAPWHSATVVGLVALGTGACLAAGAIAYAGLLAPLPVDAPDRLLSLRRVYVPAGFRTGIRLAEFADWRDRMATTANLAASATEATTLRDQGEPRQVEVTYVAGAWFSVVGARAEAGRLPEGGMPLDTAIISHALAARLPLDGRNADEAVGRAFVIHDRVLTVQAVLPETFSAIDDADVWIDARGVTALTPTGGSDVRDYAVVARLLPGRTADQARADAMRALTAVTPEQQRANWRAEVLPLRDVLVGDARPVLVTFLAAAVLVLFVACANVAMVLANRAVARSGEVAVRIALGGSRRQLARAAWFETAALTLAGTALGIWIARIAVGLIAGQTGLGLPRLSVLPATAPLLAGALGLAIIVVALCGVAPALVVRRSHLITSMRAAAGRSATATRRWRAVLIVAQLATAVVLLIGAVLLGRTLLAVGRADPGLDAPDRVATLAVPIGESTRDAAGRLTTVDRIVESARHLPGVTSAGLGGALPPSTGAMRLTIRVVTESSDQAQTFEFIPATPGYLESLGARLISGRLFHEGDRPEDAPAVLSESAARHLNLDPKTAVDRQVGLRLPTAAGTRVQPRIIGVVGDMRYAGLDAPPSGSLYVLWPQLPLPRAFLTVRLSHRPDAALPELSRIVRAADPSMPLAPPRTLTAAMEASLSPRAARFSVAGVFAGAAVLLAFVGLSGALVRGVLERQRELAIRAAVGAAPQDLVRSVMAQGLRLAVAGVAAGLALAAVLGRALSAILVGVTAYDPVTYATTAVGVVLVALAACYAPARRAAAADPLALLHAE